jgi:predicted nucleic acid-binding protein
MRTLFADTFYWVALINRGDQWHPQVIQLTGSLGSVRLVTTEEVLVEMLTALRDVGAAVRKAAVETVRDLQSNPNVDVRPQTPESFAAGLDLYERRADKAYSMTDCISMEVMRARGLTEALTHDRHFVQEGFVVLL